VLRMNDPFGSISPSEAIAIQKELASRVVKTGTVDSARYIAGVDVSFPSKGDIGIAAVVILEYPGLNVVEVSRECGKVTFPYIPGLLSFREIPLIIKAIQCLQNYPDLIIVDGHGLAHPRRMGIACHLGLYLDIPAIGCAKSRLCGKYSEPDTMKGSKSCLIDRDEVIGTVLRTRQDVRPVFISIGNRISLESAEKWILSICWKYRLPAPIRQAHMAAGGLPIVTNNSKEIQGVRKSGVRIS
jgi:deoxyribonuclease V